jgi:LmbE family N-acetylglucosaminyl deacetylase
VSAPLRLLAVLAHPDDESLGLGGTLAKYAAEGVETFLVTATRGERGWTGEPASYPGPLALGRIREAELSDAAAALGLRHVAYLDRFDGELHCADSAAVAGRIAAEIRGARPQVVVTFGPDGVYGHPDHIVISQLTTTAIVLAADPNVETAGGAPAYRVPKLYYRVWTADESAAYRAVFGDIAIDVAGIRRRWVDWPDWAITARLDTGAFWPDVWEAVACHRSQVGSLHRLVSLRPEEHRRLWGTQHFYRVLGAIGIGNAVEDDLFSGLR